MGAADKFKETAARQLETVKEVLEKEGKTLPKVVEGSVKGEVAETLNEIVSDFKNTIGAISGALESLSGGIGGILDSVKNKATEAVGGLLKSLDISNLAGGLLGGGLKIEIPNIKIGNLSFDLGKLSSLASKAESELKGVINSSLKTQLEDGVGAVSPVLTGGSRNNSVAAPVSDVETDDVGEIVVEDEVEAERKIADGTIPEGTVLKTRKEKKYYVATPRLDSKGATPSAEVVDDPEVELSSRFDSKGATPLYEYNKKKVESGEKPIFPKGGIKSGPKIDGVPVVDPKSVAPKQTKSSEKIYKARARTGALGSRIENEDRQDRLTAEIVRLSSEMNTKVATLKQELFDSGEEYYEDDPRIESIYTQYEAKIDALKAEREQVRSEAPPGPRSDAAFDAALNGESAPSARSSVETTTETTTTSTSSVEVTETGGEETVTSSPKKTEAQIAAEMEYVRQSKEDQVLRTKYSSWERADAGIRRLNTKYYPSRKYEQYESGGKWLVRRIK